MNWYRSHRLVSKYVQLNRWNQWTVCVVDFFLKNIIFDRSGFGVLSFKLSAIPWLLNQNTAHAAQHIITTLLNKTIDMVIYSLFNFSTNFMYMYFPLPNKCCDINKRNKETSKENYGIKVQIAWIRVWKSAITCFMQTLIVADKG